LMESVEYVVLC